MMDVSAFANRLHKNRRHWSKWAQRRGISCYRLYDRDIPDTERLQDLAQQHATTRRNALRKTNVIYAQLQGLTLNYPETQASVVLALGVLAEISGDPVPFIAAAFKAYWQEGADLDDEGKGKGELGDGVSFGY